MSNSPVIKSTTNSLSAKQRRAVLLIAGGSSAAEVAKILGVSRGTVHNWKSQNNEFRIQLDSTQQQLFESGFRHLRSLVDSAATSLRSVLLDSAAADRDKIAAARAVLQFADLTPPAETSVGRSYSGPDEFLERMGLQ